MKIPRFLIDQMTQKQPVLIIDKEGGIGELLADSLKHEFLPVLVSGRKPNPDLLSSLIYIPFHKKPPKIPENNFPFLFFIDHEDRYVRGIISSLVSYAKNHDAKLSIITSIYQKKSRHIETLQDDPNVRVFVTGDVFGKMNTDTSIIGPYLRSAKHKKKVAFPNHGQDDLYPVIVTAVVDAVVKTVYAPNSEGNVFILYPPVPLTGVSLSRQLFHIDSDISIDYVKSKRKIPEPVWFPRGGTSLSLPTLDVQIKTAYAELPEGKDDGTPSSVTKRLSFNIPAVFLGGLSVFLVFMMPLFLMLLFGFSGALLTQRSIDKLEIQEFSQARTLAEQAQHSFAVSYTVSESLKPLSEFVGRGVTLLSFQQKLTTAQDVDRMLIDVSYALEEYRQSQQEEDPKRARAKITGAINRMKQALLGLLTIEAEGRMPQDYAKRLAPYKQAGEYFLSVSDVLPSILGYEGKRTYLLLFQNNNELRPGGGFIGSYGIMHVENGTMTDLRIHDVYDADGQLSSHVEPPYPLREYMGVTHWYLRDSNFAVDFPENAARAAFFLKLETGEVVDGVVGLDTAFISHVLEATGPIDVLDYNETITAENFSEKTQLQIEEDFFPGSQKKKQFLTAFYDELSHRVLTTGEISLPLFLESLTTSLEEKHVLFTFAKESDQLPFTIANLSGSLWDGREVPDTESYLLDFMGVNEANLGENKVNAYVERYIKHDVTLDEEGTVTTQVAITYNNTSTPDMPFGGVYENYVRFVTPPESSAVSLVINGEERVMLDSVEDEGEIADRGPVSRNSISVDRDEERGKQTIGFLLEVPPEESLEVQIEYQTQTSFENGDPEFSYDLMLLKQPGRGGDPYSLTFSYPPDYQAVSHTKDLAKKQQGMSSFFLLSKDRRFTVLLGEK